MAEREAEAVVPTSDEIDQMHGVYRHGGLERQTAPQVVYSESTCPRPGCSEPMQAVDFRLADDGRSVHDSLVRVVE